MANQCVSCKGTKDVVQRGGIDMCQPCFINLIQSSTCDIESNAEMKPVAVKSEVHEDSTPEWELCGPPPENGMSLSPVRVITVDRGLEKHLKPHQKEGVEFLWRNAFLDYNYTQEGDQKLIGGCILAHHMGLGKSLTTITALHTAMTSANMTLPSSRKPLVRTVLCIVPANTLVNWQNEVQKWTQDLEMPLKCFQLGGVMAGYRSLEIQRWKREGGLMFLGDQMFLKLADEILEKSQPDVLFLDEAHTMLKNNGTQTFIKLQQIETKRIILATGTPLQNNLTEYYHMCEFMRRGVFGVNDVKDFEARYRRPIELGLPSDSSLQDKLNSLNQQVALQQTIASFVHRKGAEVLLKDLPPIYDCVLYLPLCKVQKKIIAIHKKKRKEEKISKNYFKLYHDVCPTLNHPGTLKLEKGGAGSKLKWRSDGGPSWLVEDGLKANEYSNLNQSRNSPKLILLAHGIAKSLELGEKVLVSSKCLKTLDIIENFLSSPDWKSQIGSLKAFTSKLGGWKKGKDYVRLDGAVQSGKRGILIDNFNNDESHLKVFLMSSEAGGIGINLCPASVVFILDNHFNPTVSQQCLARVHRYGQTKPIRCYRFAMEDSLEDKVYARSENKVSVSKGILDGFFSEGIFSSEELENFYKNIIRETCDRCGKIRILPEGQFPSDDDEEWFCENNQDPRHKSCDVPEEERAKRAVQRPNQGDDNSNDPLTKYLASVFNKATKRKGPLVSNILPIDVRHDTGICCQDAIDKLEREIAGEEAFVEESQATMVSATGSDGEEASRKRKIPPGVEVIVID